jgi:hypothetical protein
MRKIFSIAVLIACFGAMDLQAAEFVRGRPLRNVGVAAGRVVSAPFRAVRARRENRQEFRARRGLLRALANCR